MDTPRDRTICITDAGNVLIPACLVLRAKGYRVSRSYLGSGLSEWWEADKPGERFSAENPIALLGIVAIYEVRGLDWQANETEFDSMHELYPEIF